jgi:hypothetical protein
MAYHFINSMSTSVSGENALKSTGLTINMFINPADRSYWLLGIQSLDTVSNYFANQTTHLLFSEASRI